MPDSTTEARRRYPRRARLGAALALVATAGCGEAERAPDDEAAPAAAAPSASLQAAKPAEPARTAPFSPTGYALSGTRPFWGASLSGTSIRYMTPEDQFGRVVETERSFAPGRETYRGTLGGRPFVLTLRRGPCSDGVSGQVHAYSATLEVRGETRRGCADPQ